MKKQILSALLLAISLVSCDKTPKGTKQYLHSDDSVEVYKFYYNDDEFVFVSKFKTEPKIETTTWDKVVGGGKSRRIIREGNIIIH